MALTKITSRVISANAAANNIGYVPANKAGDAFTGSISVAGNISVAGPNTKISSLTNHLILHDTNEVDTGNNWWYMYRSNGDGSLKYWKNGADRLMLNSSGILSTPYKPFVNGYPNGVASSTAVKTTLTSSTVQNATFSNSRFTCPVAGLYECVLSTAVQTGYNENDVWVYKNGSPLVPAMSSWAAVNPDWVHLHLQNVIPCAANDYLEFYWRGNMYGNSSWNYFHFMHVG